MTDYKIFIPCAGLGSRLGLQYNKALVTVGPKPAISYILDKIHPSVEMVIALGHDGDNVRQVVNLLYPNHKKTYVTIDPYQGDGSGLGRTLLQSKEHLQCPFVFCPCDTIVKEDIPLPDENWMGYADINQKPDIQYRSFNTNESGKYVTEICSKNAYGPHLYIGLCGIYDYELFWEAMEQGQDVGSIESGEVYGLKHLLDKKISAQSFIWYDTGSPNSLSTTRQHFPVDANILPKDDEAIWFVNKDVVKFSIDSDFILNRCERAKKLQPYVPQITSSSPNCYAYTKQEGEVLSNRLSIATFEKLLNHLVEFWQPTTLDKAYEIDNACKIFYRDKTIKRVKQYLRTFEQIDQPEIINVIDVPSIWEILDQIDWDWLCNGVASHRFHGDLHFENILIDKDDNFTFLDWRQNFAGLMGHGDIYYDLAKLNHGIIMSHELVDKQLFSHSISNNYVQFDFLRKNVSVELEKRFEEFVNEQGYDYHKVQYLTYLIFLNIAALHHHPYGLLLYHLGKLELWKLINKNN